jgi:hypothetical protein
MSEPSRGTFTLQDIQAIRYLTLALGVVTAIECAVAKSREILALELALNVVTMVVCLLAIYAFRRAKTKK